MDKVKELQTIQNYTNYLRELKHLTDENKSFKVGDLQKVHSVDHKTNSAAKEAGILDIVSGGPHIKYLFKVSEIQPIHGRRTVERVRAYKTEWARNNTGNKTPRTIEQPVIAETPKPTNGHSEAENPEIQNYLNFFNTYNLLVESEATFDVKKLIEKHDIHPDTIKILGETSMKPTDFTTPGAVKVFLNAISLIESANEAAILKVDMDKKQAELARVAAEAKQKADAKRKMKEQMKKAASIPQYIAITVYRIFGIKIMTSETKYILKG